MNIVFQNIKIINKKTIIGILSYTNDGSYLAEMEGFEPPGGVTLQLISSQPRYDHFDTSPYFLQLQYLFLVRRDSWRELNDKTHYSNAICLRVAMDFTPGVLSYAT